MAELHIIGQIVGANSFKEKNLFCSFRVHRGSKWTLVSGYDEGQTQVSLANSDNGLSAFGHPIDVLFSTSVCVGWPQIVMEIWSQDEYGRNDFAGYGVCQVPTVSGFHEMECVCWRPVGGIFERISESLVGGKMQLRDKTIIFNGEERHKLTTWTAGKIKVQLSILENFKKFGHVMS